MTRSKYDELHDRFFTLASSKHGTRYERLAAVVLKSLHQHATVIHNLSLRGGSGVPHQIDVVIEVEGKAKRVLIEAKDFDKTGKKVGLSIVRDFRSVIEDIGPDDAFIVTCTGYTSHAQRYAKAKGVKLAVLRAFEDFDWEGYIRKVPIELHVQRVPRIERLELNLDQPEANTFQAQTYALGIGMIISESQVMFRDSDPIFLISSSERLQACAFLWRELKTKMLGSRADIEIDPNEWRLQVGDAHPVQFTKFRIVARNQPPILIKFEVTLDRVAELILKGFDSGDRIVFADQLQGAIFEEVSRVAEHMRSSQGTGENGETS